MHPVSAVRGVSWFPATMTIVAPGSSLRSRMNCWNACRIAGLVGRTLWKTSPAMTTSSGAIAIVFSIARRNAPATSASRWLMPAEVSRWYWRKPRWRSERWTRRIRGAGRGAWGAGPAGRLPEYG